jgi:hypothetical protein
MQSQARSFLSPVATGLRKSEVVGGSMQKLKLALSLAVLIGGMALSSTVSFGKPEYTKKEKKGCTYCHTKAAPKDAKDLNDVGKFYSEHKTLEGAPKK